MFRIGLVYRCLGWVGFVLGWFWVAFLQTAVFGGLKRFEDWEQDNEPHPDAILSNSGFEADFERNVRVSGLTSLGPFKSRSKQSNFINLGHALMS